MTLCIHAVHMFVIARASSRNVSLVPRLLGGGGKTEPDPHRSRMRFGDPHIYRLCPFTKRHFVTLYLRGQNTHKTFAYGLEQTR